MKLTNDQYRFAVLSGEREAANLHTEIASSGLSIISNGRVEIEDAVDYCNVTLIYQKLKNLLGVFFRAPSPGIMVTTERSSSIQRFTIAHELGHFLLGHKSSFDDENTINRTQIRAVESNEYELAAHTFASSFLFPRELLVENLEALGIQNKSDFTASAIYSLSLWIGASYQATCFALKHQKILPPAISRTFASQSPKSLKKQLLGSMNLEHYYSDVWEINKSIQKPINGKPEDVLVINLRENSSAGYLWDLKGLEESGFEIINSTRTEFHPDIVGGAIQLKVIAQKKNDGVFSVEIKESRPWDDNEPLNRVEIFGKFFKQAAGLPIQFRQKQLAS